VQILKEVYMSLYDDASNFDRAFKLGQLFDDINLSKNSPCNTCEDMKRYIHYCGDDIITYHICLDRDEASRKYLSDCPTCIKKIQYEGFCKAKLEEYERHNISTKYNA
jgi:hypothetical protein